MFHFIIYICQVISDKYFCCRVRKLIHWFVCAPVFDKFIMIVICFSRLFPVPLTAGES